MAAPLDALTLPLVHPWRQTLMTARYAFLSARQPRLKPTAYASLADLAARIHRERAGDALILRNDTIRLDAIPSRTWGVVEIIAHDQTGDRRRLLGHAWLGGRRRETLEAALHAADTQALRRAA